MKTLILYLVFFTSNIQAQNIKGLYVDGFFSILGNGQKEDSLLRFAQNNGFNYLTLYQVNQVNNVAPLSNFSASVPFASFISKAKTQFGILQIGVAGENFNFFKNNVHPYNQQHALLSEKIDVYNLEFEFWVPSSIGPGGNYCEDYLIDAGYSCDTSGAFAYASNMLKRIDSLANANDAISESYYGWFNTGQGAQLVNTGVDRILLSLYVTSANYSPNWQYNYINSRLERLASAQQNIKVLPIYSAEPSFMQIWTQNNPFFLPFAYLQTSLQNETATWKNYIQLEGIQWFAYTDLPQINLDLNIKVNEIDNYQLKYNLDEQKVIISGEVQNMTHLQLLNALGKEYNTSFINTGNDIEINTSQLSKGIYFLNLVSKRNKVSIKFEVF